MSASAATVKKAASYLGTSAKGLQTCLTRGYSGKQAAQYLGQSVVGIQRAFAKFQIVVLSLVTNAAGGVVTVTASGCTPSGSVQITWDDSTNTTANADAFGNLTRTHTYAAQGTYGPSALDFGTGASSAILFVTTKP